MITDTTTGLTGLLGSLDFVKTNKSGENKEEVYCSCQSYSYDTCECDAECPCEHHNEPCECDGW